MHFSVGNLQECQFPLFISLNSTYQNRHGVEKGLSRFQNFHSTAASSSLSYHFRACAGQGRIIIPPIQREGKMDAIPIRIISNNDAIRALATRAFNAHGGFNANVEGSPVYILKLDMDENNRVSYILQAQRTRCRDREGLHPQ